MLLPLRLIVRWHHSHHLHTASTHQIADGTGLLQARTLDIAIGATWIIEVENSNSCMHLRELALLAATHRNLEVGNGATHIVHLGHNKLRLIGQLLLLRQLLREQSNVQQRTIGILVVHRRRDTIEIFIAHSQQSLQATICALGTSYCRLPHLLQCGLFEKREERDKLHKALLQSGIGESGKIGLLPVVLTKILRTLLGLGDSLGNGCHWELLLCIALHAPHQKQQKKNLLHSSARS